MVISSPTLAILEGYSGLTGLIINGLLLWLSIGFWRSRVPDEAYRHKHNVVKRLSLTCMAGGAIFSLSHGFLLNTGIVPYSLETTQCQVVWRVAFISWAVQRCSISLISFFRLKYVFSDRERTLIDLPGTKLFISTLTLVQSVLLVSFCVLITIPAVPTGDVMRCEPVMVTGIGASESQGSVLWLLCGWEVVIAVLLPMATTLHFGVATFWNICLSDFEYSECKRRFKEL